MTISGGYLTLRTRPVKAPAHRSAHTGAIERPLNGVSLEALNHIQKTRWTMHREVLGVLEDLVKSGGGLAGVPAVENEPMPPKMDDAAYEALSKEERSVYLRKRGDIYSRNKALEGDRFRLYRLLDLGQQLAKANTLWFPHTCDFRGRVYPTAQDLHTQGDSMVKGLLTFAEAQPLGPGGQWWLYVATANAFGHDKLPLQERADWTENNMQHILEAAIDPLAYQDFWAVDKAADSPWEALAACFELRRLAVHMRGFGSAETFESHMPIRLDATCSGIQHLSAMMKDELSAACVNVLPTGRREDIYSDVMRAAVAKIAMDAVGPDEALRVLAQLWLGNVQRGTVKRAVMTTPYGVTPTGIKTQLINDGFCDHIEKGPQRYAAAEYLKDVVVSALDVNIGAPRTAMGYFQEVAQFLAEREVPLVWTTPAGFTVRQAYRKSDERRVSTLLGDKRVNFRTHEPNEAAGLDRRKQKASAAPNVVHSYDAAHLCMTAVALKDEGVRDLAFVHDSFGCHAGNVDRLNHHVRERFIDMYDGPALERWRQSVIEHSGVDDVPHIPSLGNLDVKRVRESEFFFS